MAKRISVTITDKAFGEIKLLQAAERRTESNMVALLIEEALDKRSNHVKLLQGVK